MPMIAVNGTQLYYEDTGGPGEPLLFAHGLLWSTAMFAPQIAHFRDRYRVIAWDHRGQGQSADHPERSVPIELVTADALALMDALGLDRVHLAGLSMGGFVAMRIAARHPARIRSLILLETSADPEPEAVARELRLLVLAARIFPLSVVAGPAMKKMFARSFLADPANAAVTAEWRRRLVGNRRSVVRAVTGVLEREGVVALLPRISAPTVVIVGEEDVSTPPERAERIAAGIAGAVLVKIPGAGHTSTIEQPARVIAAIEEHLERVAAS